MTASAGSWSGSAANLLRLPLAAVQSRRAWISQERRRGTYSVAAADVGATLRVAVSGQELGWVGPGDFAPLGSRLRWWSVGTAGSPPVNTLLPSISGLAQLGKTLTASAGSWSGMRPISDTYQWLCCERVVPAASTSAARSETDIRSRVLTWVRVCGWR